MTKNQAKTLREYGERIYPRKHGFGAKYFAGFSSSGSRCLILMDGHFDTKEQAEEWLERKRRERPEQLTDAIVAALEQGVLVREIPEGCRPWPSRK